MKTYILAGNLKEYNKFAHDNALDIKKFPYLEIPLPRGERAKIIRIGSWIHRPASLLFFAVDMGNI